ncbi:YciI family protein [Vineibacter terrae]|nr:YciI family protein [Vineibacter terrae]
MAKFLLLLRDNPGDFSSLSPAEIQRIIGEYRAWAEGLRARNQLHNSNKLMDDAGKIVRHNGSGVVLKDGPYTETKEVIGGYFLIEAADYAAAVAIAGTCPHVRPGASGTIEVRQIQEM